MKSSSSIVEIPPAFFMLKTTSTWSTTSTSIRGCRTHDRLYRNEYSPLFHSPIVADLALHNPIATISISPAINGFLSLYLRPTQVIISCVWIFIIFINNVIIRLHKKKGIRIHLQPAKIHPPGSAADDPTKQSKYI